MRGVVRSFSMEAASGEIELEDGRCLRFPVEVLRTTTLPEPGAEVDVTLDERDGRAIVKEMVIRPTFERTTANAVFLDANPVDGSSLVFSEADEKLFVVPPPHRGAQERRSPAQLVVLELARQVFTSEHCEPRALALAPREGALTPKTTNALERAFRKRWRAFARSQWREGPDAWAVRGLGLTLRAAGRGLPSSPVLARLLRDLGGGLEARLGRPLGPVTRALVAAAKKLAPGTPAAAFTPFGLRLTMLADASDPHCIPALGRDIYGPGTVPSIPFADNSGSVYFESVDLGDGATLDDAPIIAWESDYEEVVADDLRSFLALFLPGGEYAEDGAPFDSIASRQLAKLATHAPKKPTRHRALVEARKALAATTNSK